jgi:pyridoxine 5-phosphate synthase
MGAAPDAQVPGSLLLQSRMIQLGVNIDHIATLRQARYRASQGDSLSEPDPVHAAHEAELGGADIITVHLREDRRHIQDRDLDVLAQTVRAKLNLEMAATDEMVAIAIRRKVHMVTLVPEGRQEVTTEGGLDVKSQAARMKDVVKRLREAGITASAFIDPIAPQIDAARAAGFQICELHTGAYARAYGACGGEIIRGELGAELTTLATAGAQVSASGMRFNAGHALNYFNVVRIAALPGICELHIGHAIISRAVFVGMRQAVREMKELIVKAHVR